LSFNESYNSTDVTPVETPISNTRTFKGRYGITHWSRSENLLGDVKREIEDPVIPMLISNGLDK
jgi:hypothetical protein